MRDSGDVCGARNTQFDQEFFGLFRAETVFAHDWRDRIGDFCVADYLAELDTVHRVRYAKIQPPSGRTSLRPSQPVIITARDETSEAKISASAFRFKSNDKTPGDENYLDPPGAELLAWH